MEDKQREDKQKEHDRINLEYRISIMLLDFFERNGYPANYVQIDTGTYNTYFKGKAGLYGVKFVLIDVDYQSIVVGTDDIEGIKQKHEQRGNN